MIVNGRSVLVDGVIPDAPDMKAMAGRLQKAGERMWANMGSGDWAGRGVEALSPQSYPVWDAE